MKEIKILKNIEPYYFYLFLLINLIPVLFFKFFPTVDGASHLYNSNLILDLIKDPNTPIHNYLEFNNNLSPNWSGHFILMLLLTVFPSFIAEKIILLIYLVGLPISIRYLFKTLAIESKFALYLVFPFTYSFLFFYGFFNFNIALVFLIFGICFWLKYYNNLNFRKVIVLTVISTLICLSHLFVFTIFLLIILILNISKLLYNSDYKLRFRDIALQFITLSIGLLIMLNFIINTHKNDSLSIYIPIKDIINSIIDILPARGINYGKAAIFTKWISYLFVLFFVYLISSYIYTFKKRDKIIIKNGIWLLITFIFLVLIFIIPDSDGVSLGFVTSRLLLCLYLFLIIWLSSQEYKYWFKAIVFFIINYVNFALIIHNYKSISNECILAKEIVSCSKYIKSNSIVYPILNSDNFIHSHISNYLGVDKPMIILENYEACLNYFPLKWNNNAQFLLNNLTSNNKCKQIDGINKNEKMINYVFVLEGKNKILDNECSNKIVELLNLKYELIYTGVDKKIRLYRNKNSS